jgi:hypothetical protein
LLLVDTGRWITEAVPGKGRISGPRIKSELLIAEFVDQALEVEMSLRSLDMEMKGAVPLR